MKAAVLNRIDGKFDIEEIEIDDPVGHEVLVSVKASGLCHSDLHVAQHDFGVPLPAILGHEFAGVVEQVGPAVEGLEVGDHVVGSLLQYCGNCAACADGRTFQCTDPDKVLRSTSQVPRLQRGKAPVAQVFGTGAFASSTLVHENQLAKIPKEMPFPQAALLGCGVLTGIGAVINTAGVRPGQTVVVIGVGGIGLNVIAGAKLVGAAHIIAIDAQAKKEDLARKFGATAFINAREQDPIDAVKLILPGGADHIFEAIGLYETSTQAIKMARKGGGIYIIGLHKPGETIDVEVLSDLIVNQVHITGVYMGSSNMKRDIPLYADLYLKGKLNLDDLVSKEISLHEINDAYEELKKGGIARSVITSF